MNTCGGDLDTEFAYDVVYTMSDQFTIVSYVDYVSTAIYLMHFLHGGKGVAFGQKATIEDCVDFNFKTLFRRLGTYLGIAKYRNSDKDRVVINDPAQISPIMVDPDGTGTFYRVATSKDIEYMDLDTSDEAPARDADLHNAIKALYWENDVIV